MVVRALDDDPRILALVRESIGHWFVLGGEGILQSVEEKRDGARALPPALWECRRCIFQGLQRRGQPHAGTRRVGALYH